MKGFIYKHTAPNGKSYIGQTTSKNILNRWRYDGKGYKNCTVFYKAIEKYGWNNFSHEVLEEVEFDDIYQLNQIEENYIVKFNTLIPNGYNLITKGENKIVSDVTRKKLSEKTKEQLKRQGHYWKGRKHTLESREKMRKSSLGQKAWNKDIPMTNEQKEHLSLLGKLQRAQCVPFKGKHHSEEAKQKMREAWATKRSRIGRRESGIINKRTGLPIGTYFDKAKNKFIARIYAENKEHFLGQFETVEEADNARKQAERKFWN